MDWTKQAEAMMGAWVDAQKQMWETWQQMLGGSAKPADPYAQLYQQWQEMAAKSLAGWTGGEPIVKQVAEQVIASQSAMMRFLEITTDAWSALAPSMEAGQDWTDALQEYMDQMREQFAQSQTGITQAAEDIGELWLLYMNEIQQVGLRWVEPFKHTPWSGAEAMSGRGTEAMELTNLYWDAFERTFGSLLESPSLGLTRELNEKVARGFDRWLDFRRASSDYQQKLADVWATAFEQLMHEMAELADKGQTVDSVRELLLLWGQVADRVFVETFRTEEYVEIQGQLLNAAMAYRIQQREIMEVSMQIVDLPTRSEVDEAHRNIYELRKEVKALKKALAEMQKAAAQKPAPRRRTSTTRKTSATKTAKSADAGQEG